MKLLKNSRGQAAVEYVLMLSVVIVIGLAVLKQMNTYLTGNNGLLGGMFNQFAQAFGAEYGFTRFNLQR